jgi:Holliday junction resolvasome RuvABC endonuclease subunit
MRVLGVDQSLNATGFVVLDNGTEIVAQKTFLLEKEEGVARYARIHEVADNLGAWIGDHDPDIVCMEDYAFMAASASIVPLIELGGSMRLEAYRRGYHMSRATVAGGHKALVIQNQSSMKKFMFGKGDTKKDSAYLLKVLDITGVRFADDNVADAFMHAQLTTFYAKVVRGEILMSSLKREQQLVLLGKFIKGTKKMSEAKALAMSDEEKAQHARL